MFSKAIRLQASKLANIFTPQSSLDKNLISRVGYPSLVRVVVKIQCRKQANLNCIVAPTLKWFECGCCHQGGGVYL